MRTTKRHFRSAVLLGLIMVGFALLPALAKAQAHVAAPARTPTTMDCPAFLPEGAQCRTGLSGAGAPFLIVVPRNWNGILVLFAHGGPRLGAPKLAETIEDLERFEMLVREGYGWAGTTYRRGGYGVRSAAEDIDHLRTLAWEQLGRPRLTLLHGQSWGGNVAAKAAELYSLDQQGRRNFDGVVLTSGVLAGGTRAYQLRVDLRAVYQFYCQNHPRQSETNYPLWQGLPIGATMSRVDLAERLKECTGVGLPVAQRSANQKMKLANITRILSIDEDQILPNLAWATNTFQDMIGRLHGRNPFSNQSRKYTGSRNDRALNEGVARFVADPVAQAQLAYDSDLSGLIVAPTITVHGIHDPVASVSHEAIYSATIASVGRSDLLVQTFTNEAEHSRLSAPAYPTVFAALVSWIDTNRKPTPDSVARACAPFAQKYGQPCLFNSGFSPKK